MLVRLIKKTWFFQKAEKIKDIILQRLESAEKNDNSVLQALVYLVEAHQRLVLQIQEQSKLVVETEHFDHLNPEGGLMVHLSAFLPSRNALDVGANVGEISERLLKSGYAVHAFEPVPAVFEKLLQRLGSNDNFYPHPIAVGLADQTMELHMATDLSGTNKHKDLTQFSSLINHEMLDDLAFTGAIRVTVRSLESLYRSGEIPEDVGLLKIDTEGYDSEVIRGMGGLRPAVVVAEFYDRDFAFARSGALNLLEDSVREMRRRGYPYHIVIYRIDEKSRLSFYCNYDQSVKGSWGNVFFFQDHEVFAEAQKWCAAVLPCTYFKAAENPVVDCGASPNGPRAAKSAVA